MLNRRGLLAGILFTPAIIRTPGLLMPTHSLTPVADRIERMWTRGELITGVWTPERTINLGVSENGLISGASFIYPTRMTYFITLPSEGKGAIIGSSFRCDALLITPHCSVTRKAPASCDRRVKI